MLVRLASEENVSQIAYLHKSGIPSGFMSSLPDKLLIKVYAQLIHSEVVFVAIENNEVIGFISCATNLGKFYKKFAMANFLSVTIMLFPRIFSLAFLKKLFETITIPFRKTQSSEVFFNIETDIHQIPELLSIVTDNKMQGKGVGKMLLESLILFLKNKEIKHLKVVAGNELISANNFYSKNGFQLYSTVEIHKGALSNLYVRTIL